MQLEKLLIPKPKPGEVLVRVRAAGVCHTDLHVLKKEVGFPIPAVMGHELSGEIVEINNGPNSAPDQRLAIGQQVAATFIMPCGECSHCIKGQEDLCANFFNYNRLKGQLYDGATRLFRPDGTPIAMYSMGAMAQYAVVPKTAVYPIPQGVPFVDSAILGCAVFTAYGALRNAANILGGEDICVIGAGGVGVNILQIARALGANKIIAVDVDDNKLATMHKFGATHTVNAAKVDLNVIREITDGRGVDICIEALGHPKTFQAAVNAVADGGRAVLVGIAPAGVLGEVEITRLVRRKISIIGSYGAKARQDMPKILNMVAKGQINVSDVITKKYSLANAAQAYRDLDNGLITGRAIIDMTL